MDYRIPLVTCGATLAAAAGIMTAAAPVRTAAAAAEVIVAERTDYVARRIVMADPELVTVADASAFARRTSYGTSDPAR